jgi:hypothetical protein
MRKAGSIAVAAVLAIVAGSRVAMALGASGFTVKMSFGVETFPSDQNIQGITYPVVGDSPALFDAKSIMLYHFDRKFGRTVYAALCYPATRNVELELGFGHTDIQLEITQHNKTGSLNRYADPPEYEWQLSSFDTKKDNDFSIMTFRPGANFTTASTSGIVPYLSIGLRVMIVKAKATLDYAKPYVEGGDLYAGTDGTIEELEIDGSQVVLGLDLGSGIEFKITPVVSVTFGAAYLFQFQKAFSDFEEQIKDNPVDPGIKKATYSFDGMNVSNVSFELGMRLHV